MQAELFHSSILPRLYRKISAAQLNQKLYDVLCNNSSYGLLIRDVIWNVRLPCAYFPDEANSARYYYPQSQISAGLRLPLALLRLCPKVITLVITFTEDISTPTKGRPSYDHKTAATLRLGVMDLPFRHVLSSLTIHHINISDGVQRHDSVSTSESPYSYFTWLGPLLTGNKLQSIKFGTNFDITGPNLRSLPFDASVPREKLFHSLQHVSVIGPQRHPRSASLLPRFLKALPQVSSLEVGRGGGRSMFLSEAAIIIGTEA